MGVPRKARALVAGTIALGASALAVAGFETAASTPLTTLALFGAAVILTELFQVSNDETSLDPVDAHLFSFSSGVHLAAILVIGPWAAALVAAGGVLAVDRFRGASWRQISFNASVFALACLAGGYVLQVFGGQPGSLSLPGDLIPVAALAVTYMAVNTVLVSCAIAFSGSSAPLTMIRDSFKPELGTVAGEAGLGLALALFALSNAWNIVGLVPLVLAVYQAHARLAMLRRETAKALETFANIVDERDPYTYRHSIRVAEYVHGLAQGIGLPSSNVARLRWAGRLHDLGKIAVDASVLRKAGRLNDAEWAAMRRHPRLSARLLQRFRFAAEQARAVEYHHERFDGRGYYGVDARDLPLASHFLIVADSFDAMTTDRPYRHGLSRERALAEIERASGSQFHPAVARAFVALQRGLDPSAALTAEELAELRRASARSRLPLLPGGLKDRPELLALGGVIAALVGAGLGQTELSLAGTGVAALGLALRTVGHVRAARLASSLHEILSASRGRAEAFEGFVGRLADAWGVTWAGLVGWQEYHLAGSIELERGGGSPSETALTSWLIREAESGEDFLVAAGYELGRQGVHLALPLRRGNGALVGFLVLAAPHSLPRHVELALRNCLHDLDSALAEPPREPSALIPRTLAAAP